MAKSQSGSKPKVATLPGTGVSAGLMDFLQECGPSAMPPTAESKSTGPLPQNK
jgi:hypothetical protein